MSLEFLDNKYVSTTLTVILGLYAALLRPELPPIIKNLFNNTLFRIVVLFFVVVSANRNPKVAILTSIGFILTLDYLYAMDAKETFANINNIKASLNQEQEPEEQ